MERSFVLLYHIKGITDTGLEAMTRREQLWFIKRLQEQRKSENEANKKSG